MKKPKARAAGRSTPARAPARPRGAKVSVVASLINLTPRRVQQLVTEGVIPRPSRGQYDLGAAVRAYVAYLQQRLDKAEAPHGGEPNDPLEREKLKKLTAEAEIASMEAGRQAGALVPKERFRQELVRLSRQLRGAILAMPGRNAHRIVGLETPALAVAKLTEVARDLLMELQGVSGDDAGAPTEGHAA